MTERIITGKLEYLGWQRPWTIETKDGPVDLSLDFWRVAQMLENEPSAMAYDRDTISLRRDENSDMVIEHGGVGQGVVITKKAPAFGFSNVTAYVEAILCALNGREIVATIAPDADAFSINPAPGEDVPGVRYAWSGNMCRVPNEMEVEVCGMGNGAAACIFLTLGGRGFECAKFSGSMARTLLERKAMGTMNAGRIGNCRCVGREEE